jgi:hypothetical protein
MGASKVISVFYPPYGGRGVETAKVLTIVHKYKFKFSNFV